MKEHEEKIAKQVQFIYPSAYVVSGSGAPDFKCGDINFRDGLLDGKTKEKVQKQQTIYKEELNKIKEEGFRKNKDIFGLVINFGDLGGKEYYILEEDVFLDMLYAYKLWKEAPLK